MVVPEGLNGLRFSCECVSARRDGYSDPWAAIAQNKLLPDGTKEKILNIVAREPKTISQIAESLVLSAPTVYEHISDMVKSELLRESKEWEKRYPAERYYEPNFPVLKADEHEQFEPLCRAIGKRVADLFEEELPRLEATFQKTGVADRGWRFPDLTQYLYATMQRAAREILEDRGKLLAPEKHRNGAKWLFWAEEPSGDAEQD